MISTLSMIISGWPRSCSGFVKQSFSDKLKFGMNISHTKSLNTNLPYRLTSEVLVPPSFNLKLKCKYSSSKMQSQQGSSRIMATRADRPYLSIDKDIDTDPFLLWLGKELLRDSKSALLFLWEQPGQLKYIEWPSFQSTLKTATLTLLLVMLLIIFLSSVDSVLSYLLVLTLRRSSWKKLFVTLFLRQKRELQKREFDLILSFGKAVYRLFGADADFG